MWRIVNRLLNEILATNKQTLVSNVLGAAANQTVMVMRGVAHTANQVIIGYIVVVV